MKGLTGLVCVLSAVTAMGSNEQGAGGDLEGNRDMENLTSLAVVDIPVTDTIENLPILEITSTPTTHFEHQNSSMPAEMSVAEAMLERDRIDSLAYIYMEAGPGSGARVWMEEAEEGIALHLLAASSVLSIFICVLMFVGHVITIRYENQESTLLAVAFLTSHVLGDITTILAIKVPWVETSCFVLATIHHCIHLATLGWLFLITLTTCGPWRTKGDHFIMLFLSALWILFCGVMDPNVYRTSPPCSVSFYRGMLLGYVGPTCLILMINTGLVLARMRRFLKAVPIEDEEDDQKPGCGEVGGAAALPSFYVVFWFFEILTMENNYIGLALASMATQQITNLTFLRYHGPCWIDAWTLLTRPVMYKKWHDNPGACQYDKETYSVSVPLVQEEQADIEISLVSRAEDYTALPSHSTHLQSQILNSL